MKRDCHGSVTRDMRVTSQVRVSRDERDMSRVSHATTTTPHHTMSVVTSVGGRSNHLSIHRHSVKADRADAWMAADAANGGGW